MHYIYQFNIAAGGLTLLLLAIYVLSRTYPTKTRLALIWLMISTVVAAGTDLAFGLLFDAGTAGVWLLYLLKCSFFIANNFCVLLFFIYVVDLTSAGKKLRIAGFSAMAFLAALIFTSPFTGFIFSFKDGHYVRGPVYFILYFITFAALVGTMIIFLSRRVKMSNFQFFSIVVYMFAVVGAIAVQFFFETVRITQFACAMGQVLIYASLERPSDYMYKNTPCYNKTAFYDFIKEHAFDRFCTVIVSPKNADYLGRTLSSEAWNGVANGIIRDLHTEFGRNNVFHIEGLSFAVITRGDPVKDVVERSIGNAVEESQIYSDFQFCIISFPEFASYRDKMHETMDVILNYNDSQGSSVAWFKPDDLVRMDREILVLHAVRQALREDKFQVYYQPIMEAKTGRFVSAEALIRLNDPKLGFISPDEFIPIAEQNGLIIPIGEKVFDFVCDFWSKNNLADYGVSFIEINLSTLQCMQKDLSSRLMKIMKRHGIDSNHVNLEITETAAATNRTVMLKNMNALIGLGTAFSLDDYGTGYSNIDYLATLPLEIVKIDKSILWKAMDNENSLTILRHTLGMIHDLGLKSVAEGVETQEMVDVLSEAGCDYYQGFLFSRPLPAEEYLAFVKSRGLK